MSLFQRRSIGLLGRIFLIILLTVVIEFGASTLLYERASRLSLREDEAHRVAEHLVIAVKLMTASQVEERIDLSDQLSTDRYIVRWHPVRVALPASVPELPQMAAQITAWEPSLERTGLRLRLRSPGRDNLVVGILQLPDQSWVEFRAPKLLEESTFALNRIALALVPAIALIILGGLTVRMVLQPMRRLASMTSEKTAFSMAAL